MERKHHFLEKIEKSLESSGERNSVYRDIRDTNHTIIRLHEIAMPIWREIEKVAQKKAKQDFHKGRQDPQERVRQATYGSILSLISTLNVWKGELHQTKKNKWTIEKFLQQFDHFPWRLKLCTETFYLCRHNGYDPFGYNLKKLFYLLQIAIL